MVATLTIISQIKNFSPFNLKRGTMENVSMRKTATKTKDKEEAMLERNEDDCEDEEINETVKVDLAQKIKEWKGDLFESFNTNQHFLQWELWWELEKKKKEKQVHERFLQDLEAEEEEIMEYGEHTISNFNRETASLETKKEAWEGWKAAQELNESKQYLYIYIQFGNLLISQRIQDSQTRYGNDT